MSDSVNSNKSKQKLLTETASTMWSRYSPLLWLCAVFTVIGASPLTTYTPIKQDTDDCSGNPCVNGVCNDLVGGYQCTCLAGYEGTNCEINTDDCTPNPCVNGFCTDSVGGYVCACITGYSGVNCDINADDCSGNPCVNGVCTDLVGGYQCTCLAEYEGTNCEININEFIDPLCESKIDGYYEFDDKRCDQFYECKSGQSTTIVCVPGHVYSPALKTCTLDAPCNFCSDKSDGYHYHPTDCNKFYMCYPGLAYAQHTCQPGLYFNKEVTPVGCDYPQNVQRMCDQNGRQRNRPLTIFMERQHH